MCLGKEPEFVAENADVPVGVGMSRTVTLVGDTVPLRLHRSPLCCTVTVAERAGAVGDVDDERVFPAPVVV